MIKKIREVQHSNTIKWRQYLARLQGLAVVGGPVTSVVQQPAKRYVSQCF